MFMSLGKMGTSIIRGAIHSRRSHANPQSETDQAKIDLHFLACVRRPESASNLRDAFAKDTDMVTVVEDDNVSAATKADAIILGFRPNALHQVFQTTGMAEAVKGKLLISILAGTTETQIRSALNSRAESENYSKDTEILCAIPNIASTVSQSMTVIGLPDRSSPAPLNPQAHSLASRIIAQLGWATWQPVTQVNTVLCASGPAYMSLVLEALANAAVARGVSQSDALTMAARTMQGTAELIVRGESPASVRQRVCTPGGCSEKGLKVLEEAGVSKVFVEALHTAERAIVNLGSRK
jgi:pyrroline-5-carboxylate reductase